MKEETKPQTTYETPVVEVVEVEVEQGFYLSDLGNGGDYNSERLNNYEEKSDNVVRVGGYDLCRMYQ